MKEAPPIQYVTTPDGYNIAYSMSGVGRPLVMMPEPISHIQIYRTIEGYMREWFEGLEAHFRLLVYDDRGQGMSSRGLNADYSSEDDVYDLESVVETAGLERFILLSRSPAGVRYAARHPDRVEALVLQTFPAVGVAWPTRWSVGLASENWELFLEMLAAVPTPNAVDRSASVQRIKRVVNQDDWLLRARAMSQADVTAELRGIRVPTLVLHSRDYHIIPVEESINVASLVRNSRLVLVDGTTSRGDVAQCIRAIDDFLGLLTVPQDGLEARPALGGLSKRQAEVLRLIAEGRSNKEIAAALVLSLRTVERHVADLYTKLDIRNRAEATAYAMNLPNRL